MLWAKQGHEVAYGQEVIGTMPAHAPQTKPFSVTRGWGNIGIRGEDFEVLFSTIHGGLVSYRYAGVELFTSVPKPNFWQPPIM